MEQAVQMPVIALMEYPEQVLKPAWLQEVGPEREVACTRGVAQVQYIDWLGEFSQLSQVSISACLSGRVREAAQVRQAASTSGIHNNSTAIDRIEHTGRISGRHITAALLIL